MLVPDIKSNNIKYNDSDYYALEIGSFDDVKATYYDYSILSEEKARVNFIKIVEKLVRGSVEYKSYIGYLKRELNLTKCTFFPLIDINEIKGIKFEMHHYPFSLFDITSIVLDEHILVNNEKDIDPYTIAHEVMGLHFQNCIGIVPLSSTVHELYHSGEVFINLKYVYGNYMKFVNAYEACNTDMYKNQLSQLQLLSKDEDSSGNLLSKDVLSKKMMKLTVNRKEDIKPIKESEESDIFN